MPGRRASTRAGLRGTWSAARAPAACPGWPPSPPTCPRCAREELTDALRAEADGRRHGHAGAFVADAAGTGTVLLAAAAGRAAASRASGPAPPPPTPLAARSPLTGDWPSLRRDVDTPADLAAAARLGLGAHTAELLRAAPPVARRLSRGPAAPPVHATAEGAATDPPPGPASDRRRPRPVECTVLDMQGTVATFDAHDPVLARCCSTTALRA